MKFGDIFPLLLALLILYYAAMIAMDLYKAKLAKEAEKEKNTEEDIDISEEAAAFKPIRIVREDPKKPKPTAQDKTDGTDKGDEREKNQEKDKANEQDSKPEQIKPSSDTGSEKDTPTGNEQSSDKQNEKTAPADPYDPTNWEIPDEVIREHQLKFQKSKTSAKDETAGQEQSTVHVSVPTLHEPVMDGGMPVEDLYEFANDVAEDRSNADLQNIVMKCEAA